MLGMHRYSPKIEEQMEAFYQSLSEKDRRRYAAIEACKLGRGGLSYLARVLSCDRHTIAQGIEELADVEALQRSSIRRTGGGRKRSQEIMPGLDEAFFQVLEHHTAGSPMNAAVKWTNLTQQEIVDYLATEHGITISVTVVKQLLHDHNFVRRKAQKRQRIGECAQRDAQFAKIAGLKEAYTSPGNPLVSVDTKKKN
jgi:hypothetical protein